MATLTYGMVTGTFFQTVIDSLDDPDDNPDLVPLEGTIVLRPDVDHFLYNGVTVKPQSISVTLSDGVVVSPSGATGIKLVAGDCADINPRLWTYTVQYQLTGLVLPPASFVLHGGEVLDLANFVSVGSSSGVATLRGPQGDPGPGTAGAPYYLTWVGTQYEPNEYAAQTDRPKIFTGPVYPANTPSVIMAPNDLWFNTNP